MLYVDYSNGVSFPLYWARCPQCSTRVGPWRCKKKAKKNLASDKMCTTCEWGNRS
jgi:hypothetical protein